MLASWLAHTRGRPLGPDELFGNTLGAIFCISELSFTLHSAVAFATLANQRFSKFEHRDCNL